MNAVDTNVLVYAVDRFEPVKQQVAKRLVQTLRGQPEPTVLLWQVLGELAQQMRRWRDQGRVGDAEAGEHVRLVRGAFPLALPTAEVFDRSVVLVARFSLAHWDSMLSGACRVAGVTRLYTEDMGAPRTIDGIELINPFT